MPDYNLEGLSTRSFEQLVQAIAVKFFGPGVVLFGDGPDGAREAIFDGRTTYAPKGEPWEGYMVVQAKFHQRPEGRTKDSAWALQQVKKELKKFTSGKRKLRKPQYYIFATNVVLTPSHEAGSKDKAYATITSLKKDLSLMDFDIWDYDKIRAFLDSFEDIRRSYAAWVTPGDVLAEAISWLQPQQPDFETVLTNYLKKELLSDQYANLEQAGHTVEDRIPLATVFVDLPTSLKRTDDPPDERTGELTGFVSQVLTAATERLDPQSLRGGTPREAESRISAGPSIARYVLVGGPGQGKTTFSQFICQLFRASILGDKDDTTFSAEVKSSLLEIEKQCELEHISLPAVRRFPIRVTLSEFANALASQDPGAPKSLLSYIVHRIAKKTAHTLIEGDLRRWLAAYPWILVLDGLDEVPPSSNRADVLAAIRDFWVDATECNADILVLATTRPQGYTDEFSPALYRHRWLVPLSTTRAMHYARRLVEIRYTGEADRKNKVIKRLERACRHEATARLMRTPLQITIMATLVDRIGQPPQERWNLFKEYYNVIYQREVERDIKAAAILRDYKPDVDAIHYRVGLLLQVESERSGKTDARLPLQRLAGIVENRLREEGHKGEELNAVQRKIIDAAATRLVFLVGLQEGQVGFEIRSLQEFMAAEGLMQGGDEVLTKRLRKIAPIANWRNVFLFAAGKCFADRQYLRDTIHTICSELNEDADEALRGTLTGSQLALELLEDGPARRQPKYAQCLLRLAFRLLDLPPDDFPSRIAGLYGVEFEELYSEELTRRLSYADREKRLGGWACLLALTESRVPFASSIAEENWPTDEREVIDTLKIGASLPRILSRLTHFIPRLPIAQVMDQLRMPSVMNAFRELANTQRLPPWLDALRRYSPHMHWAPMEFALTSFISFLKPVFGFQLVTLESAEKLPVAFLEGIPNPSPSWSSLIAATRFIKNPSKQELAKQLRSVTLPGVPPVARWWIPWPLAACLETVSSRSELEALAARAETGALGDYEDWQRAEKRWRSTGITTYDVRYAVDACWPYDNNVADVGFPFSAVLLSLSATPERQAVIEKLLDLFEDLQPSRIRIEIASWVMFILGSFGHESTAPNISTNRLRKVVNDLDKVRYLDLDAIEILFQGGADDEWLRVVDDLGRQAILVGGNTISAKTLGLLWQAFASQPNRIGLLRILGQISIAGDIPAIPLSLLDLDGLPDPPSKAAAIYIRLTQGNGAEPDPRLLGGMMAEIATKNPNLLYSALGAIRDRPVQEKVAHPFLLGVLDNLPAKEWELISRVLVSLNNSLKRRTSHLDEPTVWSDLTLPGI